jgi:general secretion pathway protein A
MYYSFFGVTANPFSMTPDPAFLYLTPQHREALAGLTYALLARKGFLVLTGDAGTGKTTLLARVLGHLPSGRIKSSVILNPTLTAQEFLEMTLLDFGVGEVPATKPQRIALLRQLLISADAEGKACALIVDEAHKLTPELLEEIRLLGNLELPDHKLLQILFLGQDELAQVLNRADMRQLKQRIAARFSIGPLEAAEVSRYIQHRWTKAGGGKAPFLPDAFDAIASSSSGIPRVINAICDNALVLAFGQGANAVSANHIKSACADLDIGVKRASAAAPAAAAKAAPQVAQQLAQRAAQPYAPPPGAGVKPPAFVERYQAGRRESFIMRWGRKLGLAG